MTTSDSEGREVTAMARPETHASIGTESSAELSNARSVAWSIVRGNDHVKRAAEVAMVGAHSITLLARPGNGQTQVEVVLDGFCERVSCIAWCRCGHFLEPAVECTCTASEIRRYQNTKRFQRALDADIIVQIVAPTTRELLGNGGESLHAVLARVAAARLVAVPTGLDTAARSLLEAAQCRLGFTAEQVQRILRVASSIARLDNATVLTPASIVEAVQYQSRFTRSR